VVITDLRSEAGPHTPLIPLAYAFCQREETEKQNASTILGALARQIGWNQSDVSSELNSEYESPQRGDHPSASVIRTAIDYAISRTTRSYLVIDALDELKGNDELVRDLLSLMENNDTTTKIIVFSRPDFNLQERLAQVNQLRPDLGENKDDLKAYIESCFPDEDDSSGSNREIRQECINRAEGMFLWVKLVHKSLQKPMSTRRRLLAIREIPSDLKRVYDGIFNTIWNTGSYSRSTAFLVLLWVTHALRPIRSSAMLEAVAEFEGVANLGELRHSRLANSQELISICANLIVIDNNDYIRLCHASVSDYLESVDHTPIEPLAEYQQQKSRVHDRLAKICIDYLLLEDFEVGPAKTFRKLCSMIRKSPFLEYAAEYWGAHVSQAVDPQLQSLVLELIASPPRRELSIQIVLCDPDDDDQLWYHPGTTNELHVLSLFGLKNVAETIPGVAMLAQETDGWESRAPISYALISEHHGMILWLLGTMLSNSTTPHQGKWKTSVTHLAAARGWVDALKMLISNDPSCVTLSTPDAISPLIRSCATGHKEVAALLIANGADLSQTDSDGDNALVTSVRLNQADVVKLLLEHDADPNFRDSDQSSVLHYAAQHRNKTIVQALLQRGANPLAAAPRAEDQLPLHIASEVQAVEVIEELVQSMSDLNIKSTSGCTALHIAAWHNSYRSAECLLKHGIAKDETNDAKETALHIASRAGHFETVEVLIKAGCRVDLQTKYGSTTVHTAVDSGKMAVLECVLESQPKSTWSALLNQLDDDKETTLHLAIRRGNVGMVRYLLRRGAELVNGILESSPLHYAAHHGYKSIARILLHQTKEANQRNKNGETPLHFATQANKLDFIVQFFLECEGRGIPIDLDARTNLGRTAFLCALQEGNEEVGLFLLSKGSSSLPDDAGNYPIHHAAWFGFTALVEALLNFDGISSQGYFGRTPLLCAALRGHYAAARLLVEKCPETLNIKDSTQGSPVLVALANNHLDIADYLLDSNADPFVSNEHGVNLLHLAASKGNVRMVQRLLALGCEVGVPDRYGDTPFHSAAAAGSVEVVDVLITAGLHDINVLNDRKESCVHFAASHGHVKMLQKLKELGSQFGTPNSFGQAPSHAAASSGHCETLEFLGSQGDNFSLRDFEGGTALRAAVSNGYPRAVSLLLGSELDQVNQINSWNGDSLITEAAGAVRPRTLALLLAAGADPHRRNNLGLNALDYAYLHPPLLQQLEKSGYVRDIEGPIRYLHVAYDTIRSCCEEILQISSNSSCHDLFLRTTRCCMLTIALSRVGDFEAVKLCGMELFWHEKLSPVHFSVICDICQTVDPPGDRHICKNCFNITLICDKCLKDYLQANSKTPKALEEIQKLEREVLEVRKETGSLSLTSMVSALFDLPLGANWVSEKLQAYEEWDQKYKANGRYQQYTRPNLEFLKLIKTFYNLLVRLAEQSNVDVDPQDGEALIKCQRDYVALWQDHRPDAEMKEFICQNHEFLAISDTERCEAMSNGETLDSTTGKLPPTFFQKVLTKIDEMEDPQTGGPTMTGNESISQKPVTSDISQRQGQAIDRVDLDRPQGLYRSQTLHSNTRPAEENENLHARLLTHATDSQQLISVLSEVYSNHNFTDTRLPRRAQTFPFTMGHNILEWADDTNLTSSVGSLITVAKKAAKLDLNGKHGDVSIQQSAASDLGAAETRVPISMPTSQLQGIGQVQEPQLSIGDSEANQTSKSAPELYAELFGDDGPSTEIVNSIGLIEMLHDFEDDESRERWRNTMYIMDIVSPGFIDRAMKEKLAELEEQDEEESAERNENRNSPAPDCPDDGEEGEEDEFEEP
jgi:ankyrin repeat protein